MYELNHFANYIRLTKFIIKQTEEFRKDVVSRMTRNPYNTDPRNQLRRCYHCGLIWIKVDGCNKNTTCGCRNWKHGSVDSAAYGHMKPYYKYSFDFENENVKII